MGASSASGEAGDVQITTGITNSERWQRGLLWLGGLWISPLWWVLVFLPPSSPHKILLVPVAGFALAPLPALLLCRQRETKLRLQAKKASEESEQLRLQLETVRYRTGRLREELSAADRQARLSHQLTLLGQFTAGFLHEFNNPLAILMSRIEVLLEERKDDGSLCADLDQMLKETRYMSNIAGTLLRALRRQRGEETFTPCLPGEVLQDVLDSLGPSANQKSVRLAFEPADVPRVNLPAHVLMEVARSLISNSIEALGAREQATVWLRLDPYHSPGAKVIVRFEDNGPGVPEEFREHLFEPFISQSPGRERLGLGLFLAASLMDTYDGILRYEPRSGGGACFIIEMPPARFVGGQPYHWFVKRSPDDADFRN